MLVTNWQPDILISSLGSHRFGGALMDGMKALIGVDHCVLVQYSKGFSHPYTLLSAGTIQDSLASDCATLYDDQLYEHDPIFAHMQTDSGVNAPVIVHKLAQDFTDLEYRELLIKRCGINEKISLYRQSDIAGYCLNLYRLSSSSPYDNDSLQRLSEVGRIIDSIVQKHTQLVSNTSKLFTLNNVVDRLKESCSLQLTAREIDVCARIIFGHTSESIGLNLNISINTVLTHRKHAYEKLGIGTQNQLFAIFVEGEAYQRQH